jgi:hypothetical protein
MLLWVGAVRRRRLTESARIAGVRALGFAGACITVPYKVASIPYVDDVDEDVRTIGAANYMTIEDGRLVGHNNDGKGVVKAIEKVTRIRGKRVAMLGAGGAGRAMAVELAWAGASDMAIITRRESQGVEVAELINSASLRRTRGMAAMAWRGHDSRRYPDTHERHSLGLCSCLRDHSGQLEQYSQHDNGCRCNMYPGAQRRSRRSGRSRRASPFSNSMIRKISSPVASGINQSSASTAVVRNQWCIKGA